MNKWIRLDLGLGLALDWIRKDKFSYRKVKVQTVYILRCNPTWHGRVLQDIFRSFLSLFCNWKRFLTVSNHSTVHFYVPDELRTDLNS